METYDAQELLKDFEKSLVDKIDPSRDDIRSIDRATAVAEQYKLIRIALGIRTCTLQRGQKGILFGSCQEAVTHNKEKASAYAATQIANWIMSCGESI